MVLIEKERYRKEEEGSKRKKKGTPIVLVIAKSFIDTPYHDSIQASTLEILPFLITGTIAPPKCWRTYGSVVCKTLANAWH